MKKYRSISLTIFFLTVLFAGASVFAQDDDSTRNVIRQGLLGAGTGAIASGASGGDAGKGTLIGAGTAVIGSALLDAATTPSRSSGRVYRSSQPQQDDYYYEDEPEEEVYYEEPVQQSGSSQIIKQGLIGAGTGAIASGASGGDAGKGALIGAGTAVIGSALLDAATQPQQTRRVVRRVPRTTTRQPVQSQVSSQQNIQVSEEPAGPEGGRKKIIKKYDPSGKLISEEEIYY